jgi:hypothetical protein
VTHPQKPDHPGSHKLNQKQKRARSYLILYGQHAPFDLIDIAPHRTRHYRKRICDATVAQSLTDEYLSKQLELFVGHIPKNIFEDIRARCAAGLRRIVTQKIKEKRQGSLHDKKLAFLKANIDRLIKSMRQLEQGEIEAIARAIAGVSGGNKATNNLFY